MQKNPDLNQARALMKEHFGYSEFRGAQEILISSLLSGRDVLGIMPTGAGKSMCYQLPALMFPGITLVISPLISLMQDQVRALKQADIAGAYLNSSLTFRQYLKALDNAAHGMYKIIYVAPERLGTSEFMNFALHADISCLAVDEAHCVSQWGHDFRPSYMNIAGFVNQLPRRPVVAAFTATATPAVRDDILQYLGLQNPQVAVTGFDRENLYFSVKRPEDKKQALLEFLQEHPDQSGIVYCSTRKNVEKIHDLLRQAGYSVGMYHAGLPENERRDAQNDFLFERLRIMVATNAFGMGIDKQNVRFVVHFNMPKNMEAYYQEAGRAGRDGSRAECLLLYNGSDVYTAKFLIEKSAENNAESNGNSADVQKQKKIELDKLDQMVGYCTTGGCLRHYILNYFGQASPEHCTNCGSCAARQRIFAVLRSGSAGAGSTRRQRTLYEMLCSVRTDFAEKQNLPPELIFSDRTLEAMAVQKPQTEYDMLQIPGVSPVKYQKYGKIFLRVIQRNKNRNSGV